MKLKGCHTLVALVFALAACGDRVAGGSTDTETGALTGVARFIDGRFVANAEVWLLPADSLLAASGPMPVLARSRTNDSGRWVLSGVAPGAYHVEFKEPGGKRGLLFDRHVVLNEPDTSSVILHSPGNVRVEGSTLNVWIEGTIHHATNGVLDSVPAGLSLYLRRAKGSSSERVAQLNLRPGQDTLVMLP